MQSAGHAEEAPLLGSHPVVLAVDGQGGAEVADLGWRGAATELKDGMGYMLPAARTRANATYYGFIVLSLGIIVMVRSHLYWLYGSVCCSRCCFACRPVCMHMTPAA